MSQKPLNCWVRSVKSEVVIEQKKKQKYSDLLKKDLDYGEKKEDEVRERLEKHFACELIKTHKTHLFDYVSLDKRLFIELKSRKNTKNKYPTTMIGYNKVKYALDKISEGYSVVFAFCFTDQLCYYTFTEVKEEWKARGGRSDRGRCEINDYYYIPVSELISVVAPNTS